MEKTSFLLFSFFIHLRLNVKFFLFVFIKKGEFCQNILLSGENWNIILFKNKIKGALFMNKDRGKQIISATISLSLMGNAVRASDATEVVPAHGKFYLAPLPINDRAQ